MAEVEHRPTILMVGQGEPMQADLGEALRRHGISVAGCATAELEQAVRVYAPDLVVLVGDAAVRAGASVVRRMAGNRATDVLPVAVVSNDAVLKHDGQSFRNGAVAVVPRGSGADAIARRLTELAEEVPDRPGVVSGELNEHNLQDVVDLVSNDTKTGLLSIRSPKGAVEGMPMVVETENPSAHNMELILDRLRDAIDHSEPLEYEFHETSGGRLSALPGPIEPAEVDLSGLRGARVVILDSDELRAEKLAQVLIQRGVQIAAADFSTAVIPRIREIDPQVVVLDSGAVGGQGLEFVRAIRRDPQLRWASMLVVRWEDFWPSSSSEASPDIAQLASRIYPLIEQDREIEQRVEDEVDFDTRLELVGPGRLLRALGSIAGVRHVAISGHKRNIQIDIADNSIVGAYATLNENGTHTLQGMPALMAAWGMTAGRVSVREQDLPSVANIMMPVDEALGVVSHELGFTDGSNGSIEVNAETMPPAQPEVDEHATVPPGAEEPALLDDARTMAPPRFRHRRVETDGAGPAAFPTEEAPTNKVARLLGRVETRRQTVPATRGVHEALAGTEHTDHAVARSKKSTQLGLAPVFEALPDEALEEELTIPPPRKPTPPPPPPPPPRVQRSAPPPLFEEGEGLEPLAVALEGATMIAPAPGTGGSPAWLQAMLLFTIVLGVGVAGWLLWSRSAAPLPPEDEVGAVADAESARGLITGTVNGLEAEEPTPAEPRAVAQKAEVAEEQAGAEEPSPDEQEAQVAAAAEPEVLEPAAPSEAPAKQAKREAPKQQRKAAAQPPSIPTQGLPRDPAKASDILVHRSLPLIRAGELDLAEATLDRAWELDPKNPQAMAGYASLYLARKDADRAAKWAKKAVRKRSKRAPYHILYGDALQLQGKVSQARSAWRKALELDPGNKVARSRLAGKGARAAK
jgi:DNA-binding response OmpR family regulator/Flp pilus assembly protein TadD